MKEPIRFDSGDDAEDSSPKVDKHYNLKRLLARSFVCIVVGAFAGLLIFANTGCIALGVLAAIVVCSFFAFNAIFKNPDFAVILSLPVAKPEVNL